MAAEAVLVTLVQVVLFIAISPAVTGMLIWFKARLQGRRGPSPVQEYRDLWKLFRRHPVIPETASWFSYMAPWVVFGCYAMLGVLTPVLFLHLEGGQAANWVDRIFGWPVADFLVVIYLLGLGRFLVGLAGMDAGAPFGDLGSSREMFLHFLSEPTLILCIYALAFKTHTASLPSVLYQLYLEGLGLFMDPAIWLVLLALGLAALIEAGRLPFDYQETHLELTMIGKAIELEYSGPYLALMEWAGSMRLTFLFVLLCDLALPGSLIVWRTGTPPALIPSLALLAFFPIKLLIATALLAIWESTHVRLRLRSAIRPATLALIFSMLAVIIAVLVQ